MCNHQFIEIEKITQPDRTQRGSTTARFYQINGVRIGCALGCGEVRSIWADGKVEVEHTGHAQTS